MTHTPSEHRSRRSLLSRRDVYATMTGVKRTLALLFHPAYWVVEVS